MTTTAPNINAPDRVYQRLKRELEAQMFSPGQRLPTLRQLAKRFDVSVGAVHSAVARLQHDHLLVSRHGSGIYAADLSTRTRQVLLLNRAAGHVYADLTHHFIERLSPEANYRLIADSVPVTQPEQLPAFREKLISQLNNIDAVLINGGRELGADLVIDGIPAEVPKLCFFSRHAIPNASFGGAISDWFHGGYAAAKHLIEAGCRRIVHIVSHPHITGEIEEMIRGARTAVDDGPAGVRIDAASVHLPPPGFDEQFNTLLRQFPKLDGVMAHGDHVAAPAIGYLKEHGRRVPDDVAVVGYYNTPWTQSVTPELTSIDVNWRQIVDSTVDMLLTGEFHEQKVVHPRVVVRGSSKRN